MHPLLIPLQLHREATVLGGAKPPADRGREQVEGFLSALPGGVLAGGKGNGERDAPPEADPAAREDRIACDPGEHFRSRRGGRENVGVQRGGGQLHVEGGGGGGCNEQAPAESIAARIAQEPCEDVGECGERRPADDPGAKLARQLFHG